MGNLLTKDLFTIFLRKKRILITTFLGKSREVEDRFRKQDTFKVVEGVRLFARRTFTTPKIRTFTTPKFGHFPPPKKNICQEDNCHPQFFFFFWRTFLGFFDLQLMEDIKDGKEEVLDEVVMEHIK